MCVTPVCARCVSAQLCNMSVCVWCGMCVSVHVGVYVTARVECLWGV